MLFGSSDPHYVYSKLILMRRYHLRVAQWESMAQLHPVEDHKPHPKKASHPCIPNTHAMFLHGKLDVSPSGHLGVRESPEYS